MMGPAMDSRMERVRELLEMSLDRECTRFAREAFIEEALRKVDALLTTEPEPCEDAKVAADMLAIDCIGERIPVAVEKIAAHMDAYASQVADKRADDLRAQLDRANATLEEVAAQRNRAMEDVETLREALEFYKDSRGDEGDEIGSRAKEALAATEPKP